MAVSSLINYSTPCSTVAAWLFALGGMPLDHHFAWSSNRLQTHSTNTGFTVGPLSIWKQLYCVSVRIYKWMYNDFRQDRVCQLLNQRRRSRFMSSDWLTRDEGDKAAKSLSTISLMAPRWNRQSSQEPLALAQPTPLVDSKKNSAPLRSAMPLSHREKKMVRAMSRRVASRFSKE